MAGDTCDCCETKDVAGVVSSSLGPISFAYCKECLSANAEPEFMVRGMMDDCDDLDGVAVWVKDNIKIYEEKGKYLSLQEWFDLRGSA